MTRRGALAAVLGAAHAATAPFSVTPAVAEEASRAAEVAVPRPPHAGEKVWLHLSVGALHRGALVEVRSEDGTLLGSIAPMISRVPMQALPTYTLPLPAGAATGDRLRLRLTIREPGAPARAPSDAEVSGVEAIYVPAD